MSPYFDPDNYTDADATAEDYLAVASDIVQRLAPAPAELPLPEDYASRAARAERLIYNWLVSTRGGTLTGKGGIPGATGSKSFAAHETIKSIVSTTMGRYYLGSNTLSSLTVSSTFEAAISDSLRDALDQPDYV